MKFRLHRPLSHRHLGGHSNPAAPGVSVGRQLCPSAADIKLRLNAFVQQQQTDGAEDTIRAVYTTLVSGLDGGKINRYHLQAQLCGSPDDPHNGTGAITEQDRV